MQLTIGIDISKDRLDAYRLSDRQHIQVTNDKPGHKALIRWIGTSDLLLVVFEATGAYHRQLEATLAASGIPFAKVNPRLRAGSPRRPADWPRRTASTRPCWRGWGLFWSWKGRMLPARTCTSSGS